MSAEASRIEKVDVEFQCRGVAFQKDGMIRVTTTEVEARDLMHALADSMGYDAVKRV